MIGEHIGNYLVQEVIGVGGMGAVWKAVDELLDRPVALKVIRPELLQRGGLSERFRSEAIVLARLQHPSIAALYGLERRGADEYVMVMEFVHGRTLDSRLAEGALSWREASRIVRHVLDGLQHAHERGVVHRDIKPSNIMLSSDGRVKIMDFGIARLVGAQRQTRTGAAVGTPSYMSPEQLLGQEVDGRADVYAVGTLLFELLTNHVPFEVESDYLRMIAQLQQQPPAPSIHVADLPEGMDAIVLRALEKEVGDRWATAGDFRDALHELERRVGVDPTPVAGTAAISQTPPRGTPIQTRLTPRTFEPVALRQATSTADEALALAAGRTPVPPVRAGADGAPPATSATGAAAAEAPEPAPQAAASGPTNDEIVFDAPTRTRSRAPLVVGGVLVAAGVAAMLLRGGGGATPSTTLADSAATPAAATAPVAVATSASDGAATPAAPTPPVDSARVAPADSLALVRKDSIEAARRARRDSIRKARADSIAAVASGVFKLDGGAAPPAPTAPSAPAPAAAGATGGADAVRVARALASSCVAAMRSADPAAMANTLRGGSGIIRALVRNAARVAGGPLNGAETIDVDRGTLVFRVIFEPQATATLRAVVRKSGATWRPDKCYVDNDGGLN